MIERPILLEIPEQLVGERVVVRPLRDEDAPEMYAAIIESADHLRTFLSWPDYHRSVDDTLEFIRRTRAHLVTREDLGMGSFLRADGRFLGGCGIHPRNWRVPSFEIGYWIRKSDEGKGYVTEASRLLTALAFDQFGAQRVMIRCDARNARSKAIPERLGYTLEGTMRRDMLDTTGKPCDMLIYSMLPDEYERARTRR